MANTIYIKQGDTEPITGTVSHEGTDPPLFGASSVKIYARFANDDVNKVDGWSPSTFDADGDFEWDVQPAHVDTRGDLLVWVEVVYASGVQKTFPSQGHAKMVIE